MCSSPGDLTSLVSLFCHVPAQLLLTFLNEGISPSSKQLISSAIYSHHSVDFTTTMWGSAPDARPQGSPNLQTSPFPTLHPVPRCTLLKLTFQHHLSLRYRHPVVLLFPVQTLQPRITSPQWGQEHALWSQFLRAPSGHSPSAFVPLHSPAFPAPCPAALQFLQGPAREPSRPCSLHGVPRGSTFYMCDAQVPMRL